VRQQAGQITAAGLTKAVTFAPVDGPINDRIDDAYRAKYQGGPYLSPMISARSATVQVMPRATTAGSSVHWAARPRAPRDRWGAVVYGQLVT
jgi:hypothetical protein